MRILGFIVALVLILMGIMNGGEMTSVLDKPSILIVIGTIGGAFLMSAGSNTGLALRATFAKEPPEDQVRIGIRAFRAARHGALAGGFFTGMVGIIDLLQNYPDVSTYGPGMAMILCGALWALLFGYFILLPLQSGIEKAVPEDAVPSETSLDLTIFALWGIAVPLIMTWILFISFAK